MVVGGGAMGPEVYAKFIELAGGPDALIIDVPTAGGDSTYAADWRGTRGLKAAGARNVVVLHTIDRKRADDSAFVEPLRHAGGVWFEGGRQWHLVDSYANTASERGFHDVLARGGVVGGSSAGASILSSYMLRGAREGNAIIMAPGYEIGFGFLRGVAIDQHVVARERLADLADSLMPRHPELLGISEDEGTAWVVRGDTAEIIGRNKAFVYGGKDATDAGRPFLTLYPGDRYDLAARRVRHRASSESALSAAFVDSLFRAVGASGAKATVLVARGGKVLVDRSYGIAPQPKYMPTTTVPNFALGGLAEPFDSLLVRATGRALPSTRDAAYASLLDRRVFTPIGAHKTTVVDGHLESNVDELYRFALGLEHRPTFFADSSGATNSAAPGDDSAGWKVDRYRGAARLSAFGTTDGKRNAFVRLPESRVTVIVLTDRDDVDARGLATSLLDRLASR
jgi:cyanophycinase